MYSTSCMKYTYIFCMELFFPNCPMSLLTSQGSSGFSCPLAGSGEDSDATVWGAAPLFWGGWDWRSAGKVRAAPSVVHPTKCK